MEFIKMYNSTNKEYGYNLTSGGQGSKDSIITDKTKLKMSTSQKERYIQNPELRKKATIKIAGVNKKAIIAFKDGEEVREFKSMTEASNILNIPVSLISRVCSGKRKSTKGFIFKYKN